MEIESIRKEEYYYVIVSNLGVTIHRHTIQLATECPFTVQETVIVALCEKIIAADAAGGDNDDVRK